MTQARRHLLPPSTPLIVHCVQRCVRRAFLCGNDRYTGQSFEHRKAWVEQRIHHVFGCFAVGIHAFAVMSNHLHLVLQFEPNIADKWTDMEVAERWVRLFPPREDEGAGVCAADEQAVMTRGDLGPDSVQLAHARRKMTLLWIGFI